MRRAVCASSHPGCRRSEFPDWTWAASLTRSELTGCGGVLYRPCSDYRVKTMSQKRLTIGALAKAAAANIGPIRYCGGIGLLPRAVRPGGNYRTYGPRDLARLGFVRRARDLGFSIATVRELLRLADEQGGDCEAVGAIARTHLAEVERKIADLTALGGELRRLLGQCRRGRIADCRIIEALSPR